MQSTNWALQIKTLSTIKCGNPCNRIDRLASRTLNGLVLSGGPPGFKSRLCSFSQPVVFTIARVFGEGTEFLGKELEYCLCYLIKWGNILPVKRHGAW